MDKPYLGMTRTFNGVTEQIRIFDDGTSFWCNPTTGERLRESTPAELEEAKRAFWQMP